jgi:hypothetical protein
MFTSSSHGELLALLRAIIEAKFHREADDRDVPGSTLLAAAAIRIRDAVVAFEVAREGAAAKERWDKWMSLAPDRPEWGRARAYASSMWKAIWPRWSDEERLRAAEALLAPFEPSAAGLRAFLAEVAATFAPTKH